MPSPFEHSLSGVLIFSRLTRLGLPPEGAKKLLWCVIFSNLPDVDYLFSLLKLDRRFSALVHRGASHSLLFSFIAALTVAALVKVGSQRRKIFGITLFSTFAHVVLDYLSEDDNFPYGIMLFYPFSREYFISPFPVLKGFNYRPIERLFSLTNIYNLLFNSTVIISLYYVLILGAKLLFTKTNHGKS